MQRAISQKHYQSISISPLQNKFFTKIAPLQNKFFTKIAPLQNKFFTKIAPLQNKFGTKIKFVLSEAHRRFIQSGNAITKNLNHSLQGLDIIKNLNH